MKKVIKQQFALPHSVERVWEYLTNAELMAQWIMKNDFQPIVGRDFRFTINPIPSLNFDGIFYCRVLEIAPLEKLSYSWKSGPGEGRITLESEVVWELRPTSEGAELFLEHSGFSKEENLNFYNGLKDGWPKNGQKLADRLKAAYAGHV